MRKSFFLLVVFLFSAGQTFAQNVTEGSLFAINRKGVEIGACPLKHTNVKADITGFLARVTVEQEFENSFSEAIEAVYTFPLSQTSAVDQMTMRIGERVITGRIMKREEARKVYEQAKTEGKTAALLDQQRPNIFTQAVANILPGDKILIQISYVETLKYEDGQYEFVFPMTIGPRYFPASVSSREARKISPTISPTRNGSDISIEVNLNAGVPVEEIRSASHEIEVLNEAPSAARVSLKGEKTIPNKDFVLRYDVTGKRIEDALLTHRSEKGGYFTLILQPPDNPRIEDVTPKEIVFVLDSSGSMSGFPIEKAKEAINLSLDGLYPHDTFNLITFAGDTSVLFDQPVPATQANIERAREFLQTEGAGGGTEMMKAIRAALEPTNAEDHVRVLCFMTDGLVGNEAEIIAEVQKHPNARVFSFGIGGSVNRYLLDKIAEEGRGEAEYVNLTDDGSRAARRFYERVRTPLLTDISIDWSGLPVTDVYPEKIGDLFSAKPVILKGRYLGAASGTIRLRGKIGGQEYVREIPVDLPETQTPNDVLATLWARAKIDILTSRSLRYDPLSAQAFADLTAQTKLEIADLGLKYNLLTEFTSFVAVEEKARSFGGKPRKVEVPVNLPDGMLDNSDSVAAATTEPVKQTVLKSKPVPPLKAPNLSRTSVSSYESTVISPGRGIVSSGGGAASIVSPTPVPKVLSGGVVNGKATNLVKPAYPNAGRAGRAHGAVTVQVVIDESGNVVSATAVGGHPLLRAAAVNAARRSKFSPTMMSGKPVRVTGVIVYNFAGERQPALQTTTSETNVPEEPTPEVRRAPPTPEELAERQRREQAARYRRMIAEKLHFWIYALFERSANERTKPTETETRFVRDGKANVELRLAEKTPETLEKLKNAGFEITSEEAAKVTGKVPLEKLAALAEISEVRYVFPNLQ